MRCYFMRAGHIAGVEAIPGLPDDETAERARELFEENGNSTPMMDSRFGTSPGWFSSIRRRSMISLETADRLIATLPADQS
jgi:hypothetical protein